MEGKRCFFIGHRESGDEVYPALLEAVGRHIEELGVREFFVGRYGGFDRLAAKAVREARVPGIRLTLLLPYYIPDRSGLPDGAFDGCFYPPGLEAVPQRFAITRADRYMVDHVDYLIAYAWHPGSNAWELLEYARRRERRGLLVVTALPRVPGI